MSDEHPKCQASISYGEGDNPEVKYECGNPATHEWSDVLLCESHAEEARDTIQDALSRPIRRWRPPQADASEASGDIADGSSEFAEEQARDGRVRGPSLRRDGPAKPPERD